MPAWLKTGFADYAKRLPREWRFTLVEISAKKTSKNLQRDELIQQEGQRMLAAIPPGSRIITLDVTGQLWDTAQLAGCLRCWLSDSRDIALLIGGPEGLDNACQSRAESSWSLSRLTFPHMLVRVIVAEQLYRAWSLLSHHPYHRA